MLKVKLLVIFCGITTDLPAVLESVMCVSFHRKKKLCKIRKGIKVKDSKMNHFGKEFNSVGTSELKISTAKLL